MGAGGGWGGGGGEEERARKRELEPHNATTDDHGSRTARHGTCTQPTPGWSFRRCQCPLRVSACRWLRLGDPTTTTTTIQILDAILPFSHPTVLPSVPQSAHLCSPPLPSTAASVVPDRPHCHTATLPHSHTATLSVTQPDKACSNSEPVRVFSLHTLPSQ